MAALCASAVAAGHPVHAQGTDELRELSNQIVRLYDQGKYDQAVPLAEEALRLAEKMLGPDHPEIATSLNTLAALYRGMSNHAKAEPLLQRALAIREKTLGPDHRDTVSSLNNLALLYGRMGDYAKAEPFLQRALAIREKALGPDHPDTANSLNNLGMLCAHTGEYAKAEPLLRRALGIDEKALGADHAKTATSLNNLAELYWRRGDYAKAGPLFQRALTIREKVLGPDDTDTATSLNNLAGLYWSMGEYAKAEPLLRRALAIQEKALGSDHRDTATGLNNLAELYRSMGDYAKAEPFYQHALSVREKTLGPDHPETAANLNNLALLHMEMGDYAKAEPFLQRALAIYEKTLGPDHPDTAAGLNNLAGLYVSMSEHAKAEPLLQRALAIAEKALGPDHRDTALGLNNLAGLYGKIGDYAKAGPLLQRALAIHEKTLGPDHPDTAHSLNNLAMLYADMGDYTKAEPLLQRAFAIHEKALGPDHAKTATSLNNLAVLFLDLGQEPGALELAGRAQRAETATLANVLSFTSEEQRLAYQATFNPYSLFASMGNARGIARVILHFKGVVLDSLLEDRLVAEASRSPEDRAVVNELRSAKQRLMQLLLEVPHDLSPEARERRLAERQQLGAEVERLEKTLARRVAGLGQARRALSVTVEQVQHVIPAHAVLIEFLRYEHYLGKRRWERRYGAVALASAGEPRWVPLGSAAAIEALVTRYQKAVRGQESETQLTMILQALYQQIWAPIDAALLPGTSTMILSPDAELNFVSFATLLTPEDQFLAAKYSLRYVANGRDLLRTVPAAPPVAKMTVYANPDFTGKGQALASAGVESSLALRALEIRDLEGLRLPPLPGTAREAASLEAEAKKWKWGVERFERGQASETRLRAVRSPRVLHLATHGFFLEDNSSDPVEAPANQRGVGGMRPLGSKGATADFTAGATGPVVLRNPMHRSGLALAGAQATLDDWKRSVTPPTESDGIVTAAEVGELKLGGAWLVTLSACDTGTGEARAGEGVLGLRRGFIQAGAQNLLMTLWSVDDEQTAKLMLDFYTAARKDNNAPRALADVQRDWLLRLRKDHDLATAVIIAGPFILSSQGPVQ